VHVLLVDDEARLVASLRRGLTAEGFTVEVASDGVAGLALARAGRHDVVVFDIMLPRLSGYEALRRLRATGSTVPVLMLTAKDGEHDEADAFDLGADDYLCKPFSFLVLVARLRALARRAAAAPSPGAVLTGGGVELDPREHRVRRDGAEVELTAREFALLEHLLRATGAVVSKSELYGSVWEGGWEPPVDTDLNVVEVYIGYLRRKLGRDAVETVRGSGYRVPVS